MFSIISVSGAFKRGVSGAWQHEAGPGQSNVTFQIDSIVETLRSNWCLATQTLPYTLLSSLCYNTYKQGELSL